MINEMPRVFISYSWEDKTIAKKLTEYLKRDGAEVWIDSSEIKAGDSFIKRMNLGLERCNILLLLWSSSAEKSQYVSMEWEAALSNNIKVIPCLFDDTKLPPILSGRIYKDLRNFDHGYAELAEDLGVSLPPPPPDALKLRAKPTNLVLDDDKEMLKKYDFYDKDMNPEGRGINHKYELQNLKGDKVVIDGATKLMWQQSGSDGPLSYKDAKEYIDGLNRDKFGGVNDWRFPTLEEAMSLMGATVSNDFVNIDAIFDSRQKYIGTSDLKGDRNGFVVNFDTGKCYTMPMPNTIYVRAVRSDTFFVKENNNLQPIIPLKEQKQKQKMIRRLRSDPIELSQDEVSSLLSQHDFYERNKYPQGRGISHNYKSINDGKVIHDESTGLMWQQGGSDKNLNIDNAKKYINELNKDKYAGFNDWRLPTLEEAMSLMEPERIENGLYINPMFESTQKWTWTSDKFKGDPIVWVVFFNNGLCGSEHLYGNSYVRAVRTVQPSGLD
ncbi:MAG: DUF1566 domain-containing protein [candidate division KSB1 bacterium]|jgi:hypothetical protein|nr:DUF1566 domain-containing protein [candidate division KSB1 bacterium]